MARKLRMRHYASGPRKGYWLVSGGAWEMLVGPFGDVKTAWTYGQGLRGEYTGLSAVMTHADARKAIRETLLGPSLFAPWMFGEGGEVLTFRRHDGHRWER